MRKVVIFDLDSCISDDHWRLPLIDMSLEKDERYKLYHQQCGHDKLANVEAINAYPSHRVVIITARPYDFYFETFTWLANNKIYPHALLMRQPDDTRTTVECKLEALTTLLTDWRYDITDEDIAAYYDDRTDVLVAVAQRYPRIPTIQLTIRGVIHG